MRMNAIFAPPPALPANLQQFRFWIWLQFVMLRIYVLALTGKKCRFLTVVDHRGNVYLTAIGDPVDDVRKPGPFTFEPSAAYRAALGGEPSFRRYKLRHVSMDNSVLMIVARFLPMNARLRGNLRGNEEAIPLPDT